MFKAKEVKEEERILEEEKRRTKKPIAVKIMMDTEYHRSLMEFFRRNLGEPDRIIS